MFADSSGFADMIFGLGCGNVCAAVLNASSKDRKHEVISERGDFMGAGASVRGNVSSV
jgi:hypothetical protein